MRLRLFPIPVLVGIGHERDIALLGLVADKMVSTPTATAEILNYSWQQATTRVELNKEKILSTFSNSLFENKTSVEESFQLMKVGFSIHI